jgi:hypothetical protein
VTPPPRRSSAELGAAYEAWKAIVTVTAPVDPEWKPSKSG